MLIRRIYLSALASYEANGWRPSCDGEGRIRVLASPTGPQLYVWRRDD